MITGVRERVREGSKKPTRSFSDKQEKSVANIVKGKQTISSGSTPFSKGDVLTDKFTIECKTKTSHSDSISIKKEWISKQIQESTFMGKPYWAISFNFGPDEKNYFIIDEYLFQDLIDYLNIKKDS